MKNLMFLCLLFSSYNLLSQKNPENSLGVWYMYGGNFQLSQNWKLKSLAHFRMFDFTNDLQQYLFRVGANLILNKEISFTGGYAYLNTDHTFQENGGNIDEHRIYEDFNINHKISKLKLAHRLRIEHRFFTGDILHWIRYQIGLSYPLTKNINAFIFDEIFFHFPNETYAQNWVGGGLTYKLSNSINLKAGYMHISDKTIKLNRIQIGVIFNTQITK
ncbi:DUF2490 domain-containing protein [Tenacibaculum sp. C7A-26P2]|uniref:DUF2490 domain-containing protein n=1 Tax=Tenacibaculum sp. C7A-26P2 TaxID=3447504 RepID=UPI003F874103